MDEDRAIAKARLSHIPKEAMWSTIAKGLTTVTPVVIAGVKLHRTANRVKNRWHGGGQAVRGHADQQGLLEAEEARAAAEEAAKDARRAATARKGGRK